MDSLLATVRKVKERGDDSFTLGDLLDVYYGKKTYVQSTFCQFSEGNIDFTGVFSTFRRLL